MAQLPPEGSPIPEWIKLVALPATGAIAGHLWSRYRARLATLRWTATSQAMAFATEDFGWGKVELLYNGSPAQNLHMVYVQVQNASSRDLASVRVNVTANEKTIVLRSAGTLRGGDLAFPFADDYAKAIKASVDGTLTEQDRLMWLPRSHFVIPVLNRGAIADFKLLVARFDYATPSVAVTVEHQGVKILHQPPAKEIWGVREGQATFVGIAAGLGSGYLALHYGIPPAWLVAIAWFLGAAGQHVGAAVVRCWRALLSIAD